MPNADAALYALLSRLLASEIDLDFHALLSSPEIREILEKVEPSCLDPFDQEMAASEYCRLFVLPNGVPPVASAWLPRSEPNHSVAIVGLVHRLQSALDLSLPTELPPDHAGTLLAIMSWLLDNQPDTAIDFQRSALAPWLGHFAGALQKEAKLPIYRATGAILASLDVSTLRSDRISVTEPV